MAVFDLLFNLFRIALWPSVGKELSPWLFTCAVFMLPTSKKLTGHIGFGLSVRPSVRVCVRASMCPFVTLFDACHVLLTVHARVLKFHIWIPHGKISDPYFLSCPSYLPFWSYAPLKKSEWNLMHAISYEPCMLVFWNFIYGFLMEK